MPRTIRDFMPSDLEFQMFVLDELADDLMDKQGADVIKLTIGVTEMPMTDAVLDSMVEKLRDRDFVRRVYPRVCPSSARRSRRSMPESMAPTCLPIG